MRRRAVTGGNGRLTLAAPPPDPFGEREPAAWCERVQLLGGHFDFETDSRRLLRIVRAAYANLPAHTLADVAPRFRVQLTLAPGSPRGPVSLAAEEPPPVSALAGDGILCGAMHGASFVSLNAQRRSALLVIARDMLRYSYHIRYELLEFAVYVLAARVQGLVPLHAACLGQQGEGLLLMGPSGAGKSTVVLQGLLAGLDFLAEDSVLVKPQGLLASGVANFVHVRRDSLHFLTRAQRAALLRKSCVIRRRSGVEKLEIDPRGSHYHLAPAPLRIRAALFLSARRGRGHSLLTPLSTSSVLERLAASQRYAANQPSWSAFREQIAQLQGYELRRGIHPRDALEALRELLAGPRAPAARAQPQPAVAPQAPGS